MKSAEEIYGTAVPELPLGVRIIGFGYPKQGDYFLSQTRFESNKSLYPWNESNGPRFILSGPGTGTNGFTPAQFIVPTPIPTPEAVYHHEVIRIPEGFTKGEFRKIKPGELFLQDGGHSVSTATKDLPTLANGYGYRYVVTKNSEPKIIRVVRVIEYVGPETWINETMKLNAVGPNGLMLMNGVSRLIVLRYDRLIRELSRFQEEVK